MAAAFVVLVVVSARLYRLDDLPAEWYGDISTVYEYVMTVREVNLPRGLYVLGVGPLYPVMIVPILGILGDSYLDVKLAAAIATLAGLFMLFWFCRTLLGTWFALVATLVAGTGSWLLIYSRLGDVEAGVLLFTIGPLALAARVVEDESPAVGSAALCGLMTGCCFYLYGAVFAVPILITLVLAAHHARPLPSRGRRPLWIYLASLAGTLLPMAIVYLSSPQYLLHGHFATRLVRGDGAARAIARQALDALSAYVTRGDVNLRGNPLSLPHLDRVSLALAVAGAIFWLAKSRRRWGPVLVGGFLLMHLPSVLAIEPTPSAPRSLAAAPFAYVLVASGIWWLASLVRRWGGGAGGAAIVSALLLVPVMAVNLHRYFDLYAGGLPYQNTPIARAITTYVDLLPPGTAVHLVGSTWGPGFMPEPKSIEYAMRRPESFREEIVGRFDCARMAELARPAVLIWSYQHATPSPMLEGCQDALRPQLYSSGRGLPLFHAASLGPYPLRSTGDSTADPAAPRAQVPAGAGSAPPLRWQIATIELGGQAVEIRHLPIDTGEPRGAVDGDPTTLMRGAGDNPFVFELRYPQPTRIAAYSLLLGFMPEYRVDATITDPDGGEVLVSAQGRPEPGLPRVDLVLTGGPLLVSTARITITDIRDTPVEGWHIHLFELEQR